MTTEEAIEELENIRTPWEYMEDAKKAVEVVKAALADATARAGRLLKAWPDGIVIKLDAGWAYFAGYRDDPYTIHRSVIWEGAFATREDAILAYVAANLDAPATGEGVR